MYFQIQADQNEQEILRTMKKRRNIYMIIWAIMVAAAVLIAWATQNIMPLVGGIIFYVLQFASIICASLVVWCINNIRYVKSHGAKQGGGLLWFIFFLAGGIIFPIIIVLILRNAEKLGYKALGL